MKKMKSKSVIKLNRDWYEHEVERATRNLSKLNFYRKQEKRKIRLYDEDDL